MNNCISGSSINGSITDDHKSCQISADLSMNFLTIKPVSKNEIVLCDKPTTLKEVADAISLLKNNKSPGADK